MLLFFLGALPVALCAQDVLNIGDLYKIAVETHPSIKQQNLRLQCAFAEREGAKGAFDYQIYTEASTSIQTDNLHEQDPRYSVVGNRLISNSANLTGGLSRTYRNGLQATTSVRYDRQSDNFPLNSFSENVGANIANNVTSLNVTLSYPLLRGRGSNIVTSSERVSDINILAEQKRIENVKSQVVYGVAHAYWSYVTSLKSLRAYENNLSRNLRAVEMTKELVEAERKPRGDLLQIMADQEAKKRQIASARQSLYAAKENLIRAIGLRSQEQERFNVHIDGFPPTSNSEPSSIQYYLELAENNRMDIQASGTQLESYDVYKDVAANNLKPQLDLSIYGNYTGVESGNGLGKFATSIFQGPGARFQTGVTLRYTMPVNNYGAKAAMVKLEAQSEEQVVMLDNAKRNVEINISIAHSNYVATTEALHNARKSFDYYREVYENEEYKFKSGLSTILNLILLQERLIFSELEYIQSQMQFALAITDLRFITGTNLLDASSNSVEDIFTTLPKS